MRLGRILGLERKPKLILLDFYFKNPIKIDLVIVLVILLVNFSFEKFGVILFYYSKDGIADVLNELISTSMSLAGFVLASMAIISSIKDNVNAKLEGGQTKETGRTFFFNSPAYVTLMNTFGNSCIFYVFMFVLFSGARSIEDSLSSQSFFYITYAGLLSSSFTLVRCIYLIKKSVIIEG